MFEIKLTDFRCFADALPVEVRPITFLVGENSAGKTSFLAATRFLLESLSRSLQNPFNREPYQLGGFDQLAHYRGGPRGRANQFSIEMKIEGKSGANHSRSIGPASYRFVFVKGSPQPKLSEYVVTFDDITVKLDLGNKVSISFQRKGQEPISVDQGRLTSMSIIKDEFFYIRYLYEMLTFHFKSSKIKQDNDIKQIIELASNHFKQSISYFTRDVFASAPVRTQPLRTYTPSEIVPSSEGAHVPLEMARQKISSPRNWKSIHDNLAQFGKNSGLFNDIDIKLFTKKDDNGPFQVTVKNDGPPMNIVDVGYGVSQILPIIYQLQQKKHDTFLLQQPEVHLHPRAQAELGTLISKYSKERSNNIFVLETHSDYIIDRVRTEIARGNLHSENVTIIFFDRLKYEVRPINIYISNEGEVIDPPDNYRKFFLEEQRRILGL